MQKINDKIEELIKNKRIKTRWSELECHGAGEFLSLLFQEQVSYGSIAQEIIVENNIVCMDLFEGIPYKSSEGVQTIIKMFIDNEDNIILLTRNGSLYKYETEAMDAGDLRHRFGQD